MDRVVKGTPVWKEYTRRYILQQHVSIYGEHDMDYGCRCDTLKTIEKVQGYLFIYDKEEKIPVKGI